MYLMYCIRIQYLYVYKYASPKQEGCFINLCKCGKRNLRKYLQFFNVHSGACSIYFYIFHLVTLPNVSSEPELYKESLNLISILEFFLHCLLTYIFLKSNAISR